MLKLIGKNGTTPNLYITEFLPDLDQIFNMQLYFFRFISVELFTNDSKRPVLGSKSDRK